MKTEKKYIVGLMLLCLASSAIAQPKVIAHRGFWKTEGSAQNSIAALLKADSIGCYGSEFDVWMTADCVLVVNHDNHYKGKKMQESTAQELSTLQLNNGESIPTLQQYLTAAVPLKTKLIFELKSHATPERETKAVERAVAMVDAMGLNDRTEYIAFSLHAAKEFKRLAPAGTPVYYLNGDQTPEALLDNGFAGPDYSRKALRNNPEWINQSQQLGMKVNIWTVNSPEDMQWAIEQGVDFITTDQPIELMQLLAQ